MHIVGNISLQLSFSLFQTHKIGLLTRILFDLLSIIATLITFSAAVRSNMESIILQVSALWHRTCYQHFLSAFGCARHYTAHYHTLVYFIQFSLPFSTGKWMGVWIWSVSSWLKDEPSIYILCTPEEHRLRCKIWFRITWCACVESWEQQYWSSVKLKLQQLIDSNLSWGNLTGAIITLRKWSFCFEIS